MSHDGRAPRPTSNATTAIRGPAVAGLLAGFIDNWADQDNDRDRHLDHDHQTSTLLDPVECAERGLLQRAAERAAFVVSGWS